MNARTTSLFAALLLAAIPAITHAQDASAETTQTADQADVDAVVAEVKAALAANDLAAVNAIFAANPSIAIEVAVRVATDMPSRATAVAAAAAAALPADQAPSVAAAVIVALPTTATRADANRVRAAVIRVRPEVAAQINAAVRDVVDTRSFSSGQPVTIVTPVEIDVISPST